MKGNALLKYLAIPFLLLAGLLLSQVIGGRNGPASGPESPSLSPEEAQALGVHGDTPGDTLRTIVAESRELKKQISQALQNNDDLKRQNQDLQRHLQGIDQDVAERLERIKQEFQQESQVQNQGLLDKLQQQLDSLSAQAGSSGGADLPIGFGVRPGDGEDFTGAPELDLVWIDPQDARPLDASGQPLKAGSGQTPSGFGFPSSFERHLERGQHALRVSERTVTGEPSAQEARHLVRKAYTLPQNSTLMGSLALSALIGRVPIDGTVNDPFPFKVLIGPDNLTANGIELPEVAGAVASGTATGDWTLSCVRGQIRSLTFVFTDGRVRTLPAPADEVNQNASGSSSGDGQRIQGGLGWISDPHGIPCISGERRSNATQYIGSQSLITAAGAAAASLIKPGENGGALVTNQNGTLGTVGISGNEAMGRILSQGVGDISSWVNRLYGQAFAAVYVQPGAKVAVHLDQQLTIDYELKGRKVDYHSGASHVPTGLD